MNGMWSRFDGAFVLSCTQARETRMSKLKSELKRVGLSDFVQTVWNYPTPVNGFLLKSLKPDRLLRTAAQLDCTLGHYRILKTAYELGLNTVLVLEDDIRFLKDLDLLDAVLRDLPTDFDLAKLNWVTCSFLETARLRKGAPNWVDISGLDVRGTGCYAANRTMMDYIIRRTERAFGSSRSPLYVADEPVYGNFRVYAGVPMPCVQVDYGDRRCSRKSLFYLQRSGMLNEKFSNYAEY